MKSSRALRHLIEESGDAANAALLQQGEVSALDRCVGAVRPESPGEADVIAIAVDLADQLEAEIGKALLHAGDQCVDAVVTVAAHQGIDIIRVRRPVGRQHLAAAAWQLLVPELDIAARDSVDIGHLLSPSIKPFASAS